MRAYRVGIAGPVGSGKTALLDQLSKRLWPRVNLAVVTNGIYTKEDAEFLMRQGTLPMDRVRGVETGGCPHAAIREAASMNLDAIDDLERAHAGLELLFVESGGDNLAAAFSPELVDTSIYVIDVSGGDKIPRKGGPGIRRSGLLVINKIDLAPHVGASLALPKIWETGGEGEIRTHGTREGSTVFETAAFDHSATSPKFYFTRFRRRA